jgi:transposase
MSSMPQLATIVGVDVSKASLDAHQLGAPRTERFANTANGRRRLLAWLQRLEAPVVGLEPSGGYERALLRDLLAAGIEARFADPRRVRKMAEAYNAPAKTDAIDARFIARFIKETGGTAIVRDPDREQLRDLLNTRTNLIETAQAQHQRASMLDPGAARQALLQLARAGEAKAKTLLAEASALVRRKPALRNLVRLAQTIPGIGPLVAMTWLAQMPELGQCSGKKIAKLAGLAPFIRQSGEWKGRAFCAGGRPNPRRLMYLAAMAAKRSSPPFKAAFDRLVASGKPKMVALVAIMRRLATILNAVIRDQTPWQPNHA